MPGGETWFAAPSPGDIVWCRFPEGLGGTAGPKPRPVVVLRVGENAAGRPIVEVAYGTSQGVETLFSGEFAITPSDKTAYESSRLSFPTKFNLREKFELDYNEEWFAVPPGAPYGQTPKLGILHPSLMRRAQAAFESTRR
jgi:hypothetical protein